MTDNQASPAPAALPAAHAVAADPHHPAGDHAVGHRSADLPPAAVRKTARYAPVLLGGVAAAVLAMAVPAMASPTTSHDATGTGSISGILKPGDIVTGVRGLANGNVILTGSQLTQGSSNTLPFLYQGPLPSAAAGATVSALKPPFPDFKTGTFYGPDTP